MPAVQFIDILSHSNTWDWVQYRKNSLVSLLFSLITRQTSFWVVAPSCNTGVNLLDLPTWPPTPPLGNTPCVCVGSTPFLSTDAPQTHAFSVNQPSATYSFSLVVCFQLAAFRCSPPRSFDPCRGMRTLGHRTSFAPRQDPWRKKRRRRLERWSRVRRSLWAGQQCGAAAEGLTLQSPGWGWWGWAAGSCLPCMSYCTRSAAGLCWSQSPAVTHREQVHFDTL